MEEKEKKPVEIFTGERKPQFKEGLEEELKKRGRPKTGQKLYKQIGFKLEEANFDVYEKLAKEKGEESLSIYVKNNIDKVFLENQGYSFKISERLNYFLDNEKMEYLKQDFYKKFQKEFEKAAEKEMLKTMLKEINNSCIFKVLSNTKKIGDTITLSEIKDNDIFQDFCKVFSIYINSNENNTKEELETFLIDRSINILKWERLEVNHYVREYFLEYCKKSNERK